MPLIGAEAVAASALSFLASTIICAYVADWAGLAIAPFLILPPCAIAATATFLWLRRGDVREPGADIACGAIVAGVFAWLLWIAWPERLPVGSGPDLTHHLSLIDYIERHRRLVHDVALSTYLGEMVDYTPGLHLLAVLVGAWTGSDGLHVVYPVVAFSVALKAGLVFLVALRLLPRGVPRVPLAVASVILLFLPRVYLLGSFIQQSFLPQVLSELFAVAMWWALVVWFERPANGAMALFAVFGAATFLTWPVWTGPLLLVLVPILLIHAELSWTERLQHLAIGVIPIATIAVMHASGHVGGFRIAGTGGFVIRPSANVLGWWFLTLSAAGLIVAATERRARIVTLLIAAIAVQAAALFAAAHASGAAAPYLALKMFYLAIYPLTVAAALTLAAIWRIAMGATSVGAGRLAWVLVAALSIAVARPLMAAPRPKPVISQSAYLAGTWSRAHLPPACVDYLVADGYTAYWLHVAVLGNPRAAGRALDNDTFEPKKALVRWILPGGLPFAIADDFGGLPRDIRTSVDIVERFGPAAVVKRRGPGVPPCP
jgi:hypothetical protein